MKYIRIAKKSVLLAILIMIISFVSAGVAWASIYNAKNVTSDMNSAAYWINKAQSPNTVLLTAGEIQALNAKIYDLGGVYAREMTAYPETVDGDTLADEIEAFAPTKNLYDEGNLVEKDYFDDIRDNMDAEGLSSKQAVEWGVCIKNTSIKVAPIPKILSDEADDWAYDEFQNSTLLVNEPVAILHESEDGEWYWIAMYNCNGWVKASDVAKCSSRSQWLSLQNPTSFLMVTADEFQLDANIYTPALSKITLSMGTKLPLATAAEADDNSSIDGRLPYGNYVVKMPTRTSNGMLQYRLTLIPMSKDVHVGYLSYTTANVLNQAFKMLGDRYGWGGTLAARDCSMFTMDIYRTFGINLPRNTTGQAKTPGKITDLTTMNTVAKTSAIAGLRPGSLLQMPGHIMIYLGKVGDKLYVVSAAGTIGMAQTGSVTPSVIKARGTFINDLTMLRSTGATWLDNMATAVEIPASSTTTVSPETPSVEVVTNPFHDIDKSPYYDSIVQLAAAGIINGKTPTTFAPADKITRGEFATVLSRAFDLKQDKAYAESTFKDVKGYPLAGYVGAVAKAKFMTGVSPNLFSPKAQLSYKDTKAMLWKVLNQEVSDSATAEAILESVGADLAGTGAISRGEIAHAVDELLQALAQLQ